MIVHANVPGIDMGRVPVPPHHYRGLQTVPAWGQSYGLTPYNAPMSETRLCDYEPPAFRVPEVDLHFELDPAETIVASRLRIERAGRRVRSSLVLDGVGLELLSLQVDGKPVPRTAYERTSSQLILHEVPDSFELTLRVRVSPDRNEILSGLYVSRGILCTQCEAEGFRRITYFPDRPDVRSRFRVRLEADRARFPTLLSNGNRVAEGGLPGDRHYAVYDDPFPKPAYLFALVAGLFDLERSSFTTQSGLPVELFVYLPVGQGGRGHFALECLAQAMRFDEKRFGREYELGQYHLVAIDDFNMGAMENRSLNIFNAKYILADAEIATDQDHENILAVVAHEYFHHWTGNRITLRDWFQLSLKEGLTVYREQCFMQNQGLSTVRRIRDVRVLRATQFPEDAGPLAHPVRPESYQEIDNFYTPTVYEKGAEVIRLIAVVLGPAVFDRGLALYFERFDGHAVTLEDFFAVMVEASGRPLHPLERWFDHAGTPRVELRWRYDGEASRLQLFLAQSRSDRVARAEEPLWIPVKIGLLSPTGASLGFRVEGGDSPCQETVLHLVDTRQAFVLEEVKEPPVISVLRGFSAPVILDCEMPDSDLLLRVRSDPDGFNQWEAGQEMATRLLRALVLALQREELLPSVDALLEAWRGALGQAPRDPGLTAELCILPDEAWLCERIEPFDPQGIRAARDFLQGQLACGLDDCWRAIDADFGPQGPYRYDVEAAARRRLRLLALNYLVRSDPERGLAWARENYERADNLTERFGSLVAVNDSADPARERMLADYRLRYADHPLVLDKSNLLEATSHLPAATRRMAARAEDPGFNRHNPNRVDALVGSFVRLNLSAFHDPSGSGYAFLAGEIRRIDPFNPKVAARLAKAFSTPAVWQRPEDQTRMREVIRTLAAEEGRSPDVQEILTRCLH